MRQRDTMKKKRASRTHTCELQTRRRDFNDSGFTANTCTENIKPSLGNGLL